jgi:hypothetical protein
MVVTVNNIPFTLPTQGEQAPWGESLDAFHEQVALVLNSLKGAADILETGANIANNVVVAQDITDFKFDTGIVRSFTVTGVITRTFNTTSLMEDFTLKGIFKGTSWDLQQESVGSDSGVTFSITTSGQMQYISSSLSLTNYSGLIKFRGISILSN